MTATGEARCDCCEALRPVSGLFEPYRGAVRCRDVKACERRRIQAYDPTVIPEEDLPSPPAAAAPPGTVCAVCRTDGAPGGLYERSPGVWFCRQRPACEQRAVEVQYLHAWSDQSPDRLISSAEMRATVAAASAEIPPERAAPDPDKMAVLAAQDALGRKRAR